MPNRKQTSAIRAEHGTLVGFRHTSIAGRAHAKSPRPTPSATFARPALPRADPRSPALRPAKRRLSRATVPLRTAIYPSALLNL